MPNDIIVIMYMHFFIFPNLHCFNSKRVLQITGVDRYISAKADSQLRLKQQEIFIYIYFVGVFKMSKLPCVSNILYKIF